MGETVAMQPMIPPSSVGPVAPAKAKGRVAMVLGGVLVAGGIVLGVVLAVSGVINMADAVEDYQRVPVPGGGTVALTETGTYHLFYERPPSLVGDRSFSPSQLAIIGPDGAQLAIVVERTTSTYDFGDRHGRSIGTFRADEPGTYQIRTPQIDGQGGEFSFEPTGHIAVTRDSPFRSVGLVLGGVFGGGAMVLAGIVLLIVGGVRRSRSKQAAQAAAGAPGWGGPAPGGWAPPAPQPWTPPGTPPGAQVWAPPAPQPWHPPGPPSGAQPWTPPPVADPPPPPGWVPPPAPPAPPADQTSWPPSADGPIS